MEKVSELELELIEKNHWKTQRRRIWKDWRLYAMLLPLALTFLLWRYFPLSGLLIGFENMSSPTGFPNLPQFVTNVNTGESTWMNPFVGLTNFMKLMNTPDFWRAFRNTFLLSFYGLVFGFPFPIILALLFSEIRNETYRSVVQIFCYLPKFVSLVVITSLTTLMLRSSNDYAQAGFIASIFEKMGISNIMYTPKYFRAMYQVTGIWETAGYGSIVYFAAIIGISPTSYEAARIDGANKFAQIKYVTFPGMASTLVIMLILQIGNLLTVGYEKVILLYNPQTWVTADVISTYVYRIALTGTAKSLGAAADFFNSMIAMLLVVGSNQIARRVSSTSLY